MTRLDIITIFPAMYNGPFDESIVKRAREKGLIEINLVDLREFTHDRHRSVDDRPYGGGAGMLMKPEPIFEAVDTLRTPQSRIVLLSPQGQQFQQPHAEELAAAPHLIFICGHYEGVDERVRIGLADVELSIGDYILSNGNLAAMVVVDAIVRLLPGTLGCEESAVKESFSDGLLEYPQYTRPEEYRGMRVPEILLSGNHAAIEAWRLEMATERTRTRRPDLLV
ncbi:MAG: tRNA (guanosine(37)-N1)-methyltransferase TrmD [Lentisphaeria bacterium]|jgi:tRNA (guanine37-N1)-methyltransferase|nr:tRNA (guanosine(37)-N1)-methyltransferase TrmD [Lentisphaeria bacterium]MDP7739916.1 tRNA (guanosine(37)-N1)-methyltransferase TrmD [Lentisphaeria bacterium]